MDKTKIKLYNKNGVAYLEKPIVFKCKKLEQVDDVYLELATFMQNVFMENNLALQTMAKKIGLERTGMYHKVSGWLKNPANKIEVLFFLKMLQLQGFNFEFKITNGKKPLKDKPKYNKGFKPSYQSKKKDKIKLKCQPRPQA